jgi:DivIVA domain-containing protein
MIDLTPLDVRNKRGDFKRQLRGYDPQEVDGFLELVAERLEGLVRETLQLRERTQALQQQVESQLGREHAVQNALVTAQELRADIREQARRDADQVLKQAETEARRLIAEAEAEVRTRLRSAERQADQALATIGELERRRLRFLKTFRQLLEREMDVIEVEEGRTSLEERPVDLELGARKTSDAPKSMSGGVTDASSAAPPAQDAQAFGARPLEQDERPPLDASVTDLAAQHEERSLSSAAAHEGSDLRSDIGTLFSPTGGEPSSQAAPPRGDGLLLYLDSDETEDGPARG